MPDYEQFLAQKQLFAPSVGFVIAPHDLNSYLFPFQRVQVAWALQKGRAALFDDTGLGKTLMELAWSDAVHKHTSGDVLILTPPAVAPQTAREGQKWGVPVTVCRSQEDVHAGVNVTNYERLHLFDLTKFVGVVGDESSILKDFTGATCQGLIWRCRSIPYRLLASATPSPNDHTELGNHAEFLGIMTRTEMLSMFFTHDSGDTSKWKLMGHAEEEFWKWLSSWAVAVRKPSDLGEEYDDSRYNLLPLTFYDHELSVVMESDDALFVAEATTLTDQRKSKRNSLAHRVKEVAQICANEPGEYFLIWCELIDEAKALLAAIPGSVEISASSDDKIRALNEQKMIDFSEGKIRVLISKPSICGKGMNWQHCARVIFVGVSNSYEQTYQAIRRCWRFGQTRHVDIHMIFAETETAIVRNLKRKELSAATMTDSMIAIMRQHGLGSKSQTGREQDDYNPEQEMLLPLWIRSAA